MSISVITAIDQQEPLIKESLREQISEFINSFNVPLKSLNIDFSSYPNKTVAALVAIDVLKELTKVDKSFFMMVEKSLRLKEQIANAISVSGFIEKHALAEIKDDLKHVYFSYDYYANDFGVHWSDKGFSGYLCDDSLGSPLAKYSMMLRAHKDFANYAMVDWSDIPLNPIVPSAEQLIKDGSSDYWGPLILEAYNLKPNKWLADTLIGLGYDLSNSGDSSSPSLNGLSSTDDIVEGVSGASALDEVISVGISADFRKRD